MNIYPELKSARRLVWAGAILGYVTAATVGVLNLLDSRDTSLAAVAFLMVLSLPPTIALISLDRRPSLLPAAIVAAVLQAILLFATTLAWLLFVVVILWTMANRRRPASAIRPRLAPWWRPLIGVATLLPILFMFIHMDPTCTLMDTEGQTIEIQPNPSAEQGWILAPRLGTIETSTTGEGAVRSCASDSIRLWEASLSIVLTGAIAGAASKWPTNDQLIA